MKQALRAALDDRGYTSLTPVQTAVLDPELEGADLLVSAQTGSGKTLGFGLAIAPGLLGEAEAFDRAGPPLALVIAPTRELALQVKRELAWLYAKAGAVVSSCVGGMDMRDERRALARGAHIVVATPGRLRDHIMRGSINLGELRAVVLDEADEMLDLGFREDLEFILDEAPSERQTLLFSATVPNSIGHLAKNYQRDAVRVVTKSESAQHADIAYRALSVAERDTENAVINTLRYYEAPNAIVFANTRAMVNRLTTRLSNRGFQVVALSGELSQSERTHALQAMRDGRARVCVATDVAARGIDLPNLDLVVHAELPSNHETLLHRSGRTGRAGRKGVSALIVTKKTNRKAERILNMAKLKAEWASAPSSDAVKARDEERMLADPDWLAPVEETEAETVGKLIETFSPEQIAAAYLRLYRMSRSAPEDLADVDEKPRPREAFGPSVWFAVSGGRAVGAEPRRLLPMLCTAGGLTKDDVGAIRVQEAQSYVQIREPSVAGFLATVGPEMLLEEGATLTKLDTAPVLERGPKPAGKGPGGYKKPGAKPAGAYGSKPAGKYGDKPTGKYGDKPAGKYGDKPGDKPAGSYGAKPGGKPAGKPAGAYGGKPAAKPAGASSDTRPAKAASPQGAKRAAPPRGADLSNPSAPIDWNDAPVARVKKPKPGTKAAARKPRTGAPGGKPGGQGAPTRAEGGQPVHAKTPTRHKPGGKPTGKPGGKPGAAKGTAPPTGKPSSKKNRARAAAVKTAKAAAKKSGSGKGRS